MDFEAEGKVTVEDCLQSETSLNHRVASLLQKSRNGMVPLDQVFETNRVLLETYVDDLKDVSNDNESDDRQQPQPRRRSSLWYLSRIATVLRFLQFLLEPKNQPLSERHGEENNAQKADGICDGQQQQQIDKMVSTLLKRLPKAVCGCLKRINSNHCLNGDETSQDENEDSHMDTDATTTVSAHHLAYFLFASLLRLDRYSKTRISLMGPLWKGICEIASSAKPATIPADTELEALMTLSCYLSEGQQQARSYCMQLLDSSSQFSVQQQVGQVKLLGFIVSRSKILLKSYICIGNTNNTKQLAKHIFQPLLRLRGMATAIQLLLLDSIHKLTGMPAKIAGLLKPYVELCAKVEDCLLLLGVDDNTTQEKGMLVPTIIDSILLAGVDDSDSKIRSDIAANEQKLQSKFSDSATKFAELALHLGKAMTLQRCLGAVIDRMKNNQHQETDIEWMLCMCESLVSSCLPHCHAPLLIAAVPDEEHSRPSTTKSVVVSLISRTMQLTLKVLFKIEVSNGSKDSTMRRKVHRLLIRWLASPLDGRVQHPLHREFTITLVTLFALQGVTDKQRQRATPLSSMLSKLLFDPRTDQMLRENIGAVLLRLLSSPRTGELVSTLVMNELVRCNRQSKKRKREANASKSYSPGDLRTIGNVVTCLRPGKMDSSKLMGVIQSFCRRFEADFDNDQVTPKTAIQRQISTLVVASIEGLFVNSPRGDSSVRFQRVIGMQFPQLHSILISWTRRYYPGRSKKFDNNPKNLWLLRSVLRFCRSVCDEFGYVNNITSIKEIVSVIELCTTAPFNHNGLEYSVARQDVMFDAIDLLGSVAKVIPPTCPSNFVQVSWAGLTSFL